MIRGKKGLFLSVLLIAGLMLTGCTSSLNRRLEEVPQTGAYWTYIEPETTTVASTIAYQYEMDSNDTINRLISSFYQCMLEGDYQSAAKLVDDPSHFSQEAFDEKAAYIAAFGPINCYVMESMTDRTYIVVAKSSIYTSYSEAEIYMLEAFYCIENENGSMYIRTGSVSDEVKSYNSIMLSDSTIENLITEVKKNNEDRIAGNEELAALVGIIIPETIFRFAYEQ